MHIRKLYIIILLFLVSNNIYSTNSKLDSLLEIIETSTVDTIKGNALFDLSIEYLHNNDFYPAIKYFKQSIEYLYSNDERIAETKSYIGLCYFYQGNYSLSLEYYYKGLEIREKLNKQNLLGKSYNNIGGTYYCLKKYDEAIKYYNKSFTIANLQKDSANLIRIENNIALILNKQGKYNNALSHYLKIIELSDSLDYNLPTYYNNIAIVYINLKRYKKAEANITKAISICKKQNNKYLLANLYLNLGNILYTQNKLDNASTEYYKSIGISKSIGAHHLLKSNYKELSKYYNKKLLADSAIKYNELFITINDSLLNEHSINRITELEAKYKFDKQEQEIEQLKIKNKYSEVKNTIIIIIFISILTLIIGFFIILYFKKKRSISDKFIVKQNIEIVKYQEQLEGAITEKNQTDISKYKDSALSNEMTVILELAISKLMKKEKLYMNNDFNIYELAEKLNVSRSYVSQVINSKFGQNFNSFINELRIKEAMIIMSKKENNIYTISTISKEVGFNSISSFNIAFKKIAGVTPSFFNKSANK